MKIIVDTNVLFSAILNSSGLIGEVLLNSGNQFQFYTPEFAEMELDKYHSKLIGLTKMNSDQIDVSKRQIMKNIVLISQEAIPLIS